MEQHIDLHLHSTCSDGTFSPEEVAWRAIEADLAVISLTDHDSIEGVEAAQKEGEKLGLEVIPGTELSTQADGKDLHILGYFIQGDHPGLIDCLDTCRDERKNRAERIVKKLNSMGLRIPFEQVLAKAGDGAIGRPHVADVLVEEGFVEAMNVSEQGHLSWLEFKLKYLDGTPTFRGAKRVSRPGLRVYTRSREIPRVMGGIGTAVISTSQGVMTGPAAAKRRLGGEVLCFVW